MSHATRAPSDPLILVNPTASRLIDPVRRERIVDAVADAVRRHVGRPARIEAGTIEATRAALSDATDSPMVVVIGGDGSVREAAAALRGRDTPLAIVPAGTGNVLAGSLGIGGVGPALDTIRSGRARRLDLGLARW